MLNKRHELRVILMLAASILSAEVFAFGISDIPALKKQVNASCPHVWEPTLSRILYIDDQLTDEYGLGDDIWRSNRYDKIRYVVNAFQYEQYYEGSTVGLYSSHDGSVILTCTQARDDLYTTYLNTSDISDDDELTILDTVRDDDSDGFFNVDDDCRNTNHEGIGEGTGDFAIFDDQGNYVVDTDLQSTTTGCAAWERDLDGDSVSDYHDACLDIVGAATTTDGCADADSDGQSDPTDPYPYQNDTMCVP